jgi:hypothetical protein
LIQDPSLNRFISGWPPRGHIRRVINRPSRRISANASSAPLGFDVGATDEPVYARAWKNIVFDRDGKSHICDPVYSTEETAKADADAGIVIL